MNRLLIPHHCLSSVTITLPPSSGSDPNFLVDRNMLILTIFNFDHFRFSRLFAYFLVRKHGSTPHLVSILAACLVCVYLCRRGVCPTTPTKPVATRVRTMKKGHVGNCRVAQTHRHSMVHTNAHKHTQTNTTSSQYRQGLHHGAFRTSAVSSECSMGDNTGCDCIVVVIDTGSPVRACLCDRRL